MREASTSAEKVLEGTRVLIVDDLCVTCRRSEMQMKIWDRLFCTSAKMQSIRVQALEVKNELT